MKKKIRVIIEKAIDEYNKYRSPEATARILSIDQKFLEIEFTGSFCHTCGVYDYFDDLKILLENVGIKTKIVEVKEIDEGTIVNFVIKMK